MKYPYVSIVDDVIEKKFYATIWYYATRTIPPSWSEDGFLAHPEYAKIIVATVYCVFIIYFYKWQK